MLAHDSRRKPQGVTRESRNALCHGPFSSKDSVMREFTKGKTYASAYVKAAAVASSVTVIVMITGAGRKFG